MRCLSVVSALFLLLLFSCGKDTAGTTSETDIGIVGTLITQKGDTISGATVIAFSVDDSAPTMPMDTVTTDESGVYNFVALPSGSYSFEGTYVKENTTFKVLISTIEFDSAQFTDTALVLGIDTLVETGSIEGTVTLEVGETKDVAVSIPGTSIYGMCADGGDFILSDLPKAAAYTIRFRKEGYRTKDTMNIAVEAGKTTIFSNPIILSVDPNTLVDAPQGLKGEWNPKTSTIKLEWKEVTHPNFDGVQLYREDTTNNTGTLSQISSALIQSESYIDTVEALVVGDTVVYAYQLKSQNKKGDLGDFSLPVHVEVVGSLDALPARVEIVSPLDGETAENNDVELKWNSAGEGVTYEVWAWQPGRIVTDTIKFTTDDTAFGFYTLIPNQKYRACIRSINKTGSTVGPEITFTTGPDVVARAIGSKENG